MVGCHYAKNVDALLFSSFINKSERTELTEETREADTVLTGPDLLNYE